MSSEESKKGWTAHLPGILTGSAALIAALTTVFINLRNSNQETPAAATPVVPAVPLTTPAITATLSPQKPSNPSSQAVDLKLARLRVDNDGTLGSTDWTFDIQSGGHSLFSVPFKSLTDKAGENLVTPADPALAHAVFKLLADKPADIVVQGWKQGWIGKAAAPDVIGKAQIRADDNGFVIEAKSEKTGGPSFVLYFDTQTLNGMRDR